MDPVDFNQTPPLPLLVPDVVKLTSSYLGFDELVKFSLSHPSFGANEYWNRLLVQLNCSEETLKDLTAKKWVVSNVLKWRAEADEADKIDPSQIKTGRELDRIGDSFRRGNDPSKKDEYASALSLKFRQSDTLHNGFNALCNLRRLDLCAWERVERMATTLSEKCGNSDVVVELAHLAIAKRDFNRAISYLPKCDKYNKSEALYPIIEFLIEAKRYREALEYIKEMDEPCFKKSEALNSLFYHYHEDEGDNLDFEMEYLKIHPHMISQIQRLIERYLKKKKITEAKKLYSHFSQDLERGTKILEFWVPLYVEMGMVEKAWDEIQACQDEWSKSNCYYVLRDELQSRQIQPQLLQKVLALIEKSD